jgi:hypothetical protein
MLQNHSKVFNIDYVVGVIKTTMNHCYLWLNEDPSRNCGCFTVVDAKSKLPEAPVVIKFHIDQISDEKYKRYFDLSYEKANRLYKHLSEGHLSSFQSRDTEKDQWGGAIFAGDYILSFSGMSGELMDESIMLLLALELKLISFETAQSIIWLSNNEQFNKLAFAFIHPLN